MRPGYPQAKSFRRDVLRGHLFFYANQFIDLGQERIFRGTHAEIAELRLSPGKAQTRKDMNMPPLPFQEFQGNAQALTVEGLSAVCQKLGIHAPEIWTVLAVETSGCGFLPDRRPQILYERHIFHRLTDGQYDDGDISDAKPGGYSACGAHQYTRLAAAIAKDRAAALQSCSWGIGQIMGENYARAGFAGAEQMVAAMSESEDQQLVAMGNFLVSFRMSVPLQAHDWASFARGYNGANYAIHRYDIRLHAEFQKYSAGALPDLNVRAAQLYLTYLGFHPGPIDGMGGTRTRSALADFQAQRGLEQTSTIYADAVAQLSAELADLRSGRDRRRKASLGAGQKRPENAGAEKSGGAQ
jgi:hypothetical protein